MLYKIIRNYILFMLMIHYQLDQMEILLLLKKIKYLNLLANFKIYRKEVKINK